LFVFAQVFKRSSLTDAPIIEEIVAFLVHNPTPTAPNNAARAKVTCLAIRDCTPAFVMEGSDGQKFGYF
jgi:hypothetical protein